MILTNFDFALVNFCLSSIKRQSNKRESSLKFFVWRSCLPAHHNILFSISQTHNQKYFNSVNVKSSKDGHYIKWWFEHNLTSALIPAIWIHFRASASTQTSHCFLFFSGSGLESGGHYLATEGSTLLSNSQLRPGARGVSSDIRGVSGDRMQLNTGLHRGQHLTTDREFKVILLTVSVC